MSRGDRVTAWILDATAVALALAFLLFAGRQIYMGTKAALAERLIAQAFAAHIRDGSAHRPWAWADIHPVAALEVPRLDVRRHVLTGASGSSLAFGIGHVDGTALPNTRGNCVLAGHRDNRFAFLQELRVGDELILTTRAGRGTWTIEAVAIVHEAQINLLEASTSRQLTLMTCYPFEGLTPGNQRFVVWCRPSEGLMA